MGFQSYQTGNLGFASVFHPGDLDQDAAGWIYVTNYFQDTPAYLYFASDISGTQINRFKGTGYWYAFGLAIARNLNYDLDRDGAIDNKAIYSANLDNLGGITFGCTIHYS